MYKSCQYCHRIHDIKYQCPNKPKKKQWIDQGNKLRVEIRKFRDGVLWRKKREQIQGRDMRLCQICIRNLYNTINQYTFDNTSVHHICALVDDWDKRLDDDNLITLCSVHHSDAERGLIPKEILLQIVKEQESKGIPPY